MYIWVYIYIYVWRHRLYIYGFHEPTPTPKLNSQFYESPTPPSYLGRPQAHTDSSFFDLLGPKHSHKPKHFFSLFRLGRIYHKPTWLICFFSFAYHATRKQKPTPMPTIYLHIFLNSMFPNHTTQACHPSIDFETCNKEPPLSRRTLGQTQYPPPNYYPMDHMFHYLQHTYTTWA